MVLKYGVINIKAAGYYGACTVSIFDLTTKYYAAFQCHGNMVAGNIGNDKHLKKPFKNESLKGNVLMHLNFETNIGRKSFCLAVLACTIDT